MSKSCRICAAPLPEQPLLHFNNMPGAAQFLPDLAQLAADCGVDLTVFQCKQCGQVQTGSDPVPYYREVVRAAAFSEEMKAFRREQFVSFVRKHNLHDRKLLEIGCGRGEYLALWREAGVAAHGLEYAQASVEDCLRQGLPTIQGYVEQAGQELAGAPYDAFATLNFLEHWPDPNASLRGIAHNLRDGALGLVEVPNFDMILQRKLFTEFISDHLLYFTRETLETLLRLNGFEVLECKPVWHDYILSSVVRKRAPCDVSAFDHARQQLKTQIDAFLHRHAQQGIAIWGAGHQALAAIALLELGSNIRYVVDSAPFKQDKFTPASHIPIVAPAKLDSEPVGAIIVMAASYSDEVARTIRQRWGSTFQLAILRDHGLELL